MENNVTKSISTCNSEKFGQGFPNAIGLIESKFIFSMHNYIWSSYYIPSFVIMHRLSGFRGVVMTRF